MIVTDINQTLRPPAGAVLNGVFAEGSFLRLSYQQTLLGEPSRYKIIDVFLNDMGREVLRTEAIHYVPTSLDWSGTHPDHVKASNRFTAAIKLFWRDIVAILWR